MTLPRSPRSPPLYHAPLSRILPPFGALTADEKAEFWTSAPIAIPLFGGEKARVQFFVFEEKAHIPEDMILAARAFLALHVSAREAITPHLHALAGASAGDVWARVSVQRIDVSRRDEDEIAYVTATCACDWDGGLQIVLREGVRFVRVSAFDGYFTDGDARGDPALDAWMDDPAASLPIRGAAGSGA